MKAPHLTAAITAIAALLAAPATAQVLPNGNIAGPLFPQPGSGSLFPTPIPPQGSVHGSRDGFHRGMRHGFNGSVFIYEEPDVVEHVYEREIIREVPVEAPAPPPPPRERYVIGHNYDSLPGGCMKMIDNAGKATYFNCSGDWYREVGRSLFKAVAAPL